MSDPIVTICGNVTGDPQLAFTASGDAWARFTIAHNSRRYDKQTGQWVDAEPLFLACTVWRQMAEHVAESVMRGTRVIAQGRLRQRSFETREGEKRTVYELQVDEIGPSLRFATATVKKTHRQHGTSTPGAEDPWATPTAATTGFATPVSPGSQPEQAAEPPF